MSDFKPVFLKPSDATCYLDKNDSALNETTNFIYNKYHSLSIETQRQRLPIFSYRNHILYLLETKQTLILVGETGCGKSTQIPQYMIEAEWPGTIGVTESRRVAAVSLANRVADETGTLVQGDSVGYSIQWDSCLTKPKIKYMTEGILIREMMADPLLTTYSAIMVDEVHERTLYTDILMGLLKKIIKKRKSLRLIVASATMDAEHLKDFFNINKTKDPTKDTAVILTVEGRVYPVDVFYLKEPVPDYIQGTVDTVLKIHEKEPPGDILAFLTGQEEVERAVRLLDEHAKLLENESKKQQLLILPMYGSLPNREQLKVFKSTPQGQRKVVIATNLAETSITISGIVYVIDCGFVKLRWFNAETHTDSLVVVPTSKASAEQRGGRAGRMRSGKVYRLYTEDEYEKLTESTPPEMQRTNLLSVVLQLKALGIDNVLRFNFPTPPPAKNLLSALELLYALHAIDDNGNLTEPHGATMAEFALDPLYSKILLASDLYYDTISAASRKTIHSDARNIILRLIQFFYQRKAAGEWTFTVEKATELPTVATGKSEGTIKSIKNESLKQTPVVSLTKKRYSGGSNKIVLDDFDQGILRRTVHKVHTDKKKVPIIRLLVQCLKKKLTAGSKDPLQKSYVKNVARRRAA